MESRPNILVIVSDDQGAWATAHSGAPELRTPNLDRLARWGKRFDSLYCVSPVCSPARASIMTGKIPSNHGVHDWIRAGNSSLEREFHQHLIDYLDGHETYAEMLAAAGYRCGLAGKWHLGNTDRPARGFDFWRAFPTGGGSYRDPWMIEGDRIVRREGYVSEIVTDYALDFLDSQDLSRPWCLNVHYTAPHAPWAHDQHEAEDVALFWPDCDFPSLPRDPMHPDIYDPAAYPADPGRRREILSGYAAAIHGMDRQIGRILDHLERSGMLEDTFILFTSDNGMNMGHHGIYGKGNGTDPINLFETSVRVPGIAVHRGRIAPGRLNGVYSHYDILPTLLTMAGLEERIPAGLPGRDLSAVLCSDTPEEEGFAVVFDEYGPHRMIRRGDWKYVHRDVAPGAELYNLADDPKERNNLAALPDHMRIRQDLAAELAAWFARYADPQSDGRALPVRGGGQIDHLTRPLTGLQAFRLHDGRAVPASPDRSQGS